MRGSSIGVLWQSERQSLTEAIAGLEEKERAILADSGGDRPSRARRLGEYRISIELLRSDLSALESKHDLSRWRQPLSASLKIYETHLERALDTRKRQERERLNTIDPLRALQ